MVKQNLNSTLIYILSILGFLCCCFFGFGVIPSAIAYFIANKKLKEASIAPENYDNISGINTAKTIALVVLIINIVFIIYVGIRIYTVGWDAILEQSRQIQEEWMKNQSQGT